MIEFMFSVILCPSRVYAGMTGLKPEERFTNHKAGIKAASVVKRCGMRLLPQLYTHLPSRWKWI